MMPSADEILGPEPSDKPTADELLGPEPPTVDYAHVGEPFGGSGMSGTAADAYMSQGPIGHILNAFGQGVKDGWGADTTLAPETEKFLKATAFDKGGDARIMKTFNEAIVRPFASTIEVGMRAANAALGGIVEGATAIEPHIGAAIEASIDPAVQASVAGVGPVGPALAAGVRGAGMLAEASGAVRFAQLAKARSLGVIGEGEGAYMGTAERKPVDPEIQAQAVKDQVEAAPEQPETPAATPTPEPAPAPDIHAVARQIAPETFNGPNGYDALVQRQDTFRRWIDELSQTREEDARANAPHAEEIAGLQAKLEDATPRMAKKYQARLDELTPEHDAYIDEQLSKDTPDMARIRGELQKTDYAMRDLAPEVSAAYRQAQEQMPQAEAPAEVLAEAQPEAVQPAPVAEAPQEPQPAEAPQAPAAAASEAASEQQPSLPSIASDVSQKLVAAGRPEEEANAAAALVQAHYEARAARFGHDETAEDMYARDGANIEGAVNGRKGEQGRTVLKDGQATIRLMKNADASTFIHETGHHWLDEMMRDAENERAPDDLKADAKTVRSWLGTEEGEIPTRAHEKFARGFERYLMEGRAPSQALASVFAKFKNWLTQIYQTVAKLRSPISDDIRDVFDRLLSANPERTVIAPDKEPAKAFADIHEADAETTPPEHATPVADNIRSEINTIAKDKVPDVHEKLPDNGPAETGREPGADQNPPGGANAAEPVAGNAGNAAQSGALAAGGNEAAAEGSGLRATAGKGSRNTAGKSRTEQPAGPNERFAEPAESALVDKAGNIRLDNLGTPEDVNAAIRQAADENEGFITARRGVISDAQVLDLADALGMDAAELNTRKLGQAFNAEQIVAARKLLIQSATTVRDAMVKAADGSDADLMAYAEAKTRHRMIQEQVSGITAEAGRALRAFRALEGAEEAQMMGDFLQQATGQTLFQLRREAELGKSLDTPQKVSKFINDSVKPSFGDMVLEYWINGLISGPATHTTYSVGNTLLALWRAIPETAIAGALGALHGGERVFTGEVGANLYGIVRGTREGVLAAWQAAKTGVTTALPGEDAAKMVMQSKAIPGVVGEIARAPSRVIAMIHSFFRALNYSMAKDGLAYRTAAREGLTGTDFARRVGEVSTNPSEEVMAQARGVATDLTLMGQGGAFTQALSRLTNTSVNLPLIGQTKLLKFIDPFVHISSNVIEQSLLQRTPLGVFSSQIRNDLMGKNGSIARDQAAARMIAGTALGVTMGGLAAEGLVSGSGPSDPKEAAMWRLAGNQAHSIKIGDVWYDAHRLGPLGMLVGVSGDLYEVAHALSTEDSLKVAGMLSHAFTQNILDESFMRGPADLIRALSDQDRYGAAYVRNMAASFVPFSVGSSQIARAIDPDTRQARTLMDAVKAKIPFLSETLLPRRDIWGEAVPNKDVLGPAGLSAIYEQKVSNDPVNQAMLRLGIYPAQPSRKIRNVELTDQQYDDYSRIAGRLAKMRLDQTVVQPGFTSLPPAAQQDIVTGVIRGSREAASSLVMMKNPGIIQAAMDAKTAPLRDNTMKQRGSIKQAAP